MKLSDMEEADGPLVFAHACKLGLEGIVSKRRDSSYRSGRSPHWIKSKNPQAPGDQAGSRGGMGPTAEGEFLMANPSGEGWSAKLTRTIVLKDGTTLATLADVRTFILNEPDHIQERGSWQHAAELMILAAERGGSIEAATIQIENALFLEARYVRP
jgi:hypothetical protein